MNVLPYVDKGNLIWIFSNKETGYVEWVGIFCAKFIIINLLLESATMKFSHYDCAYYASLPIFRLRSYLTWVEIWIIGN